jgi:hypothetical protein
VCNPDIVCHIKFLAGGTGYGVDGEYPAVETRKGSSPDGLLPFEKLFGN